MLSSERGEEAEAEARAEEAAAAAAGKAMGTVRDSLTQMETLPSIRM